MLHRDVKPANILLTDPDGQAQRIYLADFGVARHIDDSAGLTAENTTVGTVAYAAPEQLKAEPIDGRADQYALACTAFHLLTGVPPFVHANPGVVITQHVNEPPPSILTRTARTWRRWIRCSPWRWPKSRPTGLAAAGSSPTDWPGSGARVRRTAAKFPTRRI